MMSSGHRTVAVFLTVISGLVVTILGLTQSWPPWIWPAAALAVLALGFLLTRLTRPAPDPFAREFTPEPDLPIPPPERRTQEVRRVTLPSRWEDYDFLFSATVRWCPVATRPETPATGHAGLAVNAVLERAASLTRELLPYRASLARHQLNGALGVMLTDPTGRLDVMAEDVTLSLSEADSQRLDRLSTVRKEEAVWQHERKHECDKRAYLGDDVLKNTGSAVVWWLAKNDDQIKRAVDDIGTLAQLTSAANNDDVPEKFQHMVPYPLPAPEPEPEPEPAPEPGTATSNGFAHGAPGTFTTGTPFPHDGTRHDGTPRAASPADLFGDLLGRLGFAPEDDRVMLLARHFAHTATGLGASPEVRDITARFDTPSHQNGPDNGHQNGPEDRQENGAVPDEI